MTPFRMLQRLNANIIIPLPTGPTVDTMSPQQRYYNHGLIQSGTIELFSFSQKKWVLAPEFPNLTSQSGWWVTQTWKAVKRFNSARMGHLMKNGLWNTNPILHERIVELFMNVTATEADNGISTSTSTRTSTSISTNVTALSQVLLQDIGSSKCDLALSMWSSMGASETQIIDGKHCGEFGYSAEAKYAATSTDTDTGTGGIGIFSGMFKNMKHIAGLHVPGGEAPASTVMRSSASASASADSDSGDSSSRSSGTYSENGSGNGSLNRKKGKVDGKSNGKKGGKSKGKKGGKSEGNDKVENQLE